MKNVFRLSLLLCSIPLMLTSCEVLQEKKAYCVETYDSPDYKSGMCYQVSASDISETVFIVNLPLNPDDESKEFKYDLEWKSNIPLDCFSFTEGLVGKKVDAILTIGQNILRLNINGRIDNQEATSGYIKIKPSAFKAKTQRVRDAYVYAYFAIGASSDVVIKPDLSSNE